MVGVGATLRRHEACLSPTAFPDGPRSLAIAALLLGLPLDHCCLVRAGGLRRAAPLSVSRRPVPEPGRRARHGHRRGTGLTVPRSGPTWSCRSEGRSCGAGGAGTRSTLRPPSSSPSRWAHSAAALPGAALPPRSSPPGRALAKELAAGELKATVTVPGGTPSAPGAYLLSVEVRSGAATSWPSGRWMGKVGASGRRRSMCPSCSRCRWVSTGTGLGRS